MAPPVLERFITLVDAFRYANLEVEPSFALVLDIAEARMLYRRLMQDPTVSYYVSPNPPDFVKRTLLIPGGSLVPPPEPSREHNVWGSILGITIIIKGLEDE